MNAVATHAPAPIGLLAELTRRCPLRCPYCSNPLELDRRSAELDTEIWKRAFGEAAALGVLHVHLSGGEPTVRPDIVELTAHCASVGLYSNLITSGVGQALARLDALADAGLDHVQLSVQAAEIEDADRIGGFSGGHRTKLAFAERVVALGLPLTVNAVIHRGNIGDVGRLIDLSVGLGAKRVEIAHTQYHGWAKVNRAALMPIQAEVDASVAVVEEARERLEGRIVIDLVMPDYYSDWPKPCMGGWGRRTLNISPSGRVLPCHAAETIAGIEFWSVADHSLAEIWRESPAFNAFRGTAWMPEPCRGCERKERDWGGCRCQALALTGDASSTDPACRKSPLHDRMQALAAGEAAEAPPPYIYRGVASRPQGGPQATASACPSDPAPQ